MLSPDELEKLRKAGRVSAEARDLGLSMCQAGTKLYDIAEEVEGYIRKHGCGLAFPCNISLNQVAAHYTPSPDDDSKLEIGDIVKIDCGGFLDGFIGDTAGTAEVGTHAFTNLVMASKRARDTVAEFVSDGVPLSEIGSVIEQTVKREGFKVVENLCGHQISQWDLHAGLSIPPYDSGDSTPVRAGMTFAVEPFATNGTGYVDNGRPGNIVVIARDHDVDDPKAQEFLEYVRQEFRTVPFCARSCDFKNAEKHVRYLLRKGVLSGFAQLVEAGGGMVSQWEYTFYIPGEGQRAEVTTLP
ncbi:methionine aminopeptidase, type II [Thermoplasmatales archaeon BRNA1]|nr:methionine aminopeptidase, type II [Thermoplasmatales archaeon BRNA1]